MPCWYYDKRELKNTPSHRDGIDNVTEHRYRREGARFIIDTGSKLGLRYDTCATGVTYFHRFYMFHSFKEFHRYVTGACCLFLAGKVEETPKKCKDIVKMAKSSMTDAQFAVFGDDPKEEVMTLERILLQTIKFDLQVEQPYACLLKFAKRLRGDREKVQKMVQMGWTFVNDSLCTTLCLQWEAEIISIALMYLASRLSKYEITDWEGKPPGFKGKWWDGFVEDVNLELLEDICHQVLDLYSSTPKNGEDSPPQQTTKPKPQAQRNPSTKRSRSSTPQENAQQGFPPAKVSKIEASQPPSKNSTPAHIDERKHAATAQPVSSQGAPPTSYSQYNPYMSSQMYSSSFMSQKGADTIQSLIGGGPPPAATQGYAPPANYSQPRQQAPPGGHYQQQNYQQQYQQPSQQQQYAQQPGYSQNYPTANYQQPQTGAYKQQQPGYPGQQGGYGANQYQQHTAHNQSYAQGQASYQQQQQNFAARNSYPRPRAPSANIPGQNVPQGKGGSALTVVRISGRQ